MRVSEMITIMRERMIDQATAVDTDDSVLFDWLQQAYLRIQRQSNYWGFLHSRGLIFSSTSGTFSYSLPTIREIDRRTMYSVLDGSSVKLPLFNGNYSFWVEENRHSVIPTAQPLQLIEAPNNNWILYPTPNNIYHVYGDYWSQPDVFIDEDDEPIWHEDFHNLVWLTALATGIPRTIEDRYAESARAELVANIPSILTEFQRRYLPDFKGLSVRF
jgi:hypothetical protein